MQHAQRLQLALYSLHGLTVGDAFGERYFRDEATTRTLIAARARPLPWTYTDDTQMALSVVEVLARYGTINQDALAQNFADNYESWRGYGPAMHGLLSKFRQGLEWRSTAQSLFEGHGSYGNGAAMRVAPLGAFFCDDLAKAAAQARLSAEVTHVHQEGIAGAIAVAVAAAYVGNKVISQIRPAENSPAQQAYGFERFLQTVLSFTPDGKVRSGIERALLLGPMASARAAASQLGNGSRISAPDTVPFCLWCAARHSDDYEAALWAAAGVGGDMDTNCAIVGGIIATGMSQTNIPNLWQSAVEPWPRWFTTSIEAARRNPPSYPPS